MRHALDHFRHPAGFMAAGFGEFVHAGRIRLPAVGLHVVPLIGQVAAHGPAP